MLLWEMRDVGHILSDVGFTLPTWWLVFAEEVATTISYFMMLIYYLTFLFFTIIRKDLILGWVKYVPQTRATFYSFSFECKYNPYISTMDQFKTVSVQLI